MTLYAAGDAGRVIKKKKKTCGPALHGRRGRGSPSLSHTNTHTLSHSLTLSPSLSLSRPISPSFSSPSLSLSPSLSFSTSLFTPAFHPHLTALHSPRGRGA